MPDVYELQSAEYHIYIGWEVNIIKGSKNWEGMGMTLGEAIQDALKRAAKEKSDA